MAKVTFPTGKETQKASRLAEKGELFRIRRGIYIDTSDPEEITKTLNNKWMEVACNIIDGPVAVARTAVELKPAEGRLYFVSSKLRAHRAVNVWHLNFDISPGNTNLGVERVSLEILNTNTPFGYSSSPSSTGNGLNFLSNIIFFISHIAQ
jgi:hypothetical protein